MVMPREEVDYTVENALEMVQRDRPDKGMVFAVLALAKAVDRVANVLERPPVYEGNLRLNLTKEKKDEPET
jgi:hypothetical protein